MIQDADNHLFFKADIDFLFNEGNQSDITLFRKWFQVAKEIFNDNGLTQLYKEKEIFLRVLVSKFNSIEFLKEIYYDTTKDNLKVILRSSKLRILIQEILDQEEFNVIIQTLNNNSSIQTNDEYIDIQALKLAHEDLYKTEFLNSVTSVTSGSYFRQEYHNFILYPYNAKSDKKKFIIGSPRNKQILVAIQQGIIELNNDQQLYSNKNIIPYFWGWNIFFKYKGYEYIWHYKEGIIVYNSQDIEAINLLEELKNILYNIN